MTTISGMLATRITTVAPTAAAIPAAPVSRRGTARPAWSLETVRRIENSRASSTSASEMTTSTTAVVAAMPVSDPISDR